MHQSKYTETPIFSTKAHVFHIDPQTKRSWISASSQAVNVNFYYDASRNVYRIISVEGQKPVINSTITPNMTFTKTSQKFGQWSDIRANTVYGLGFSSEPELNKVIVAKLFDVASSSSLTNLNYVFPVPLVYRKVPRSERGDKGLATKAITSAQWKHDHRRRFVVGARLAAAVVVGRGAQ